MKYQNNDCLEPGSSQSQGSGDNKDGVTGVRDDRCLGMDQFLSGAVTAGSWSSPPASCLQPRLLAIKTCRTDAPHCRQTVASLQSLAFIPFEPDCFVGFWSNIQSILGYSCKVQLSLCIPWPPQMGTWACVQASVASSRQTTVYLLSPPPASALVLPSRLRC